MQDKYLKPKHRRGSTTVLIGSERCFYTFPKEAFERVDPGSDEMYLYFPQFEKKVLLHPWEMENNRDGTISVMVKKCENFELLSLRDILAKEESFYAKDLRCKERIDWRDFDCLKKYTEHDFVRGREIAEIKQCKTRDYAVSIPKSAYFEISSSYYPGGTVYPYKLFRAPCKSRDVFLKRPDFNDVEKIGYEDNFNRDFGEAYRFYLRADEKVDLIRVTGTEIKWLHKKAIPVRQLTSRYRQWIALGYNAPRGGCDG